MPAVLIAASSQAELMKEATITNAQAEKIALAGVPHGTIKTGELEREHGLLIWSFNIKKPGTRNLTEVQVDAKTGKIASLNVETPKDQAKEAAADRSTSRTIAADAPDLHSPARGLELG
jgi:Peptidase propeptide and YPEB domain